MMDMGKSEGFSIGIIANSIVEPGMSGGNRIFIECAKRWLKKGVTISIFTSDVGEKLCRDNGLDGVGYSTWVSSRFNRLGIVALYLIGAFTGSLSALKESPWDGYVIYSSSDFWPDSIPAFITKLRNRRSKWIAGFYLFAPNPLYNGSPFRGREFIKGLLYWVSQVPVYWLVKKYADMVFVTNEPDRKRFIDARLTSDKVIAIRGGVDMEISSPASKPKNKEYDAVFIGRFHPTKGVLELIDIWKHVHDSKKDAKLAMIGIGELEKQIEEKIRKNGLEDNVKLLGFKDGAEKIKIFKESRVALYPATFDHWSMAPVEAMGAGLPLVTFDVPTLKFLHPKGMIRTPCYDLKAFADGIIKLLSDRELYKKTQEDATEWAAEWSWDRRTEEILGDIKKIL